MAVVPHIKETSVSLDVLQRRATVSYNFHALHLLREARRAALIRVHLVAIARFRKETYRVFGVLELQLAGTHTGTPKEYLAGEGKGKYSIADIGTWAWVKNSPGSGYTEEEMGVFPHLLGWIKRIAERPAVQRGIGEKYKQ